MKRIEEKLYALKQINVKYKLPIDTIDAQLDDMKNFKVCTPIVGGFSTGKSSLLNALLEENILKTAITAETAIPTEIYDGNNQAVILSEERKQVLPINQFIETEFDATTVNLIQLGCDNAFLKEIKDVKIVDMPGFDSGIELHNRAINNYLPKSLSYIVVFSADDMVLRESIGTFLKELNMYQMPICIVITKCDKVTENILELGLRHLKEILPKYIDMSCVKFYLTKAKKDKDVKGLKAFLLELQSKANEIFETKYTVMFKGYATETEKYLNSRIKNAELSVSDLDEKEEALKKETEDLFLKLDTEKSKLKEQMNHAIARIDAKIKSDLQMAKSSLADTILAGNDINEKINTLVRMAVSAAIKKEFEPKMQTYLKNITSLVSVTIVSNTNIKTNPLKDVADNFVKDTIIDAMPVLTPVIGGIIGTGIASLPALAALGSIAGPVGAIVGAGMGVLVEGIFHAKKQEEKLQLVMQEVEGMIPDINKQAIEGVLTELENYIDKINKNIEEEVTKKRDLLLKALQDVREQKEKEEKEKTKLILEITKDLEDTRGIMNGL